MVRLGRGEVRSKLRMHFVFRQVLADPFDEWQPPYETYRFRRKAHHKRIVRHVAQNLGA